MDYNVDNGLSIWNELCQSSFYCPFIAFGISVSKFEGNEGS